MYRSLRLTMGTLVFVFLLVVANTVSRAAAQLESVQVNFRINNGVTSSIYPTDTQKTELATRLKPIAAEHVGVCKESVSAEVASGVAGIPGVITVKFIIKPTATVTKANIQDAVNAKMINGDVMKVAILAEVKQFLSLTQDLSMTDLTKGDQTFPASLDPTCATSTSSNSSSGALHYKMQPIICIVALVTLFLCM
mmetsp:Transcript_28518/g.45886  ORF Transcript_28518/g.45886 Transcript_28518/m.45886 type:complete len:195 (-) Transcript_28518:58-642(-)